MLVKRILAVSLFANAALVVALVYFSAQRGGGEAAAVRAVAPPPAPVVRAPRPIVVSSKVSPEAAKILMLAELEAEAYAAVAPSDAAFWQKGSDEEFVRTQQALEAELDQVRTELLETYGLGAAEDPAFARVLRPLNARFPYLSSKSQLALLKLQQVRRSAPTAGVALKAPGADPQAGVATMERQRDFERQLRAAIGDAEFAEYQLREAPVAKYLRENGGFTSEKEFRDAFRVLQQMEDDRSPGAYVAGQEKLKDILGEARYVEYSASRDPRFAALQAAGNRLQLKESQIRAAYGVMVRSQTELLAATGGEPARGRAEPQRIVERRDTELASLVGNGAAQDLVRTYTNQEL